MLADRIDALRAALLTGDVAEIDAIATDIETSAQHFPLPDPRKLQRSIALLQATMVGLRAAGDRVAALRGTSSVYDAQGRRQMHSAALPPAWRW